MVPIFFQPDLLFAKITWFFIGIIIVITRITFIENSLINLQGFNQMLKNFLGEIWSYCNALQMN